MRCAARALPQRPRPTEAATERIAAHPRRHRPSTGSQRGVTVASAQVAGYVVALLDLAQRRHLDLAPRLCVGASRVEATTGRRLQRAWHVTLHHPLDALDG